MYWEIVGDKVFGDKAVGDTNETIGHIPDGLSRMVAPALKKEIVLQLRLKRLDIPVMRLKENGR